MSASPQNPGAGLAASDLRMQAREQRNSSNRDELRRSDALPSLLAFARLRRQERESPKALIRARRGSVLDGAVLDHVLQQVAERALTMTGADGVAIAMRQSDEIICRASVGTIAPEVGTRVTPSAGFSGECLVSGSVVLCDDSEKDARVDAAACGGLGARSMLAVPLSAKWKVIGLIEAFSSDTFGFNDADVRSLSLLAELILAAVRPDEEERRAESARHGGAQAASAAVMAQPPIAKAEERPVWPGTTAQENASQIEIGATSYERHEVARIEAVGSAAEEAVEKSDRAAAVQLARERLAIPDAAAVSTESVETALTEAAAVEPEVEEQATTLGLALPTEWIAKWTGPGLVAASVLVVLMSGAGLWFAHKTSQASAKAVVPVHTQAGQDGYPAQSPVMPVTDLESSNVSTTEVPIKPGETVSVTGLRHWSSGDVSTVAIDLGNHVQYEAHRLAGPERIYFDLHDTKLAANFGGKAIDVQDPLLQRVRVGQSSPGVTRVVLETKGTPDYAVSLQQNPYRLVVEIHEAGAKPQERVKLALFAPMAPIPTPMKAAPAADTSAASTKPATPPALPNVFPKAMPAEPTTAAAVPTLHIALDAGHGGWDLGTVGKTGLLEKDLVLDVVARLGQLVQSRMGATVIYTRQNDDYVPLEKRAEIANLAHADLFLSVHANYSDSVSARGVETYYSNSFSSVKARDPRDGDAALTNVTWTNIDIREKVHDSHRFASSVQHALFGALVARNPGLPNRGVKEAEYVVLTGTSMPAVLAEVSFVSSPTDEGNLKNPGYRQQIAEALYQGIAGYEKDAGRAHVASAKSH